MNEKRIVEWRMIVEVDGKERKWIDRRPLPEIINSYLEKVGKKLPDKKS